MGKSNELRSFSPIQLEYPKIVFTVLLIRNLGLKERGAEGEGNGANEKKSGRERRRNELEPGKRVRGGKVSERWVRRDET